MSLRAESLDVRDGDGLTVLHRYVKQDQQKMVHTMIKRGSNINSVTNEGKTSISLAAEAGNSEMCELLLRLGAYPHYEDIYGKDACDYAMFNGVYGNILGLS